MVKVVPRFVNMSEGGSFHNNLVNREFYVNYDFDCDCKGIIYLVKRRIFCMSRIFDEKRSKLSDCAQPCC